MPICSTRLAKRSEEKGLFRVQLETEIPQILLKYPGFILSDDNIIPVDPEIRSGASILMAGRTYRGEN
jgi:hypothetical protein